MVKKEGPGWRLARDPSRGMFSVMIGGEDWAIELTELEAESLLEVINQLIFQFNEISKDLMEDEMLTIDKECLSWKAFLKGNKYKWSLKLILKSGGERIRGAELFWPIPAAQCFTAEMREMWDSN